MVRYYNDIIRRTLIVYPSNRLARSLDLATNTSIRRKIWRLRVRNMVSELVLSIGTCFDNPINNPEKSRRPCLASNPERIQFAHAFDRTIASFMQRRRFRSTPAKMPVNVQGGLALHQVMLWRLFHRGTFCGAFVYAVNFLMRTFSEVKTFSGPRKPASLN
jgi:hypothetical protein